MLSVELMVKNIYIEKKESTIGNMNLLWKWMT